MRQLTKRPTDVPTSCAGKESATPASAAEKAMHHKADAAAYVTPDVSLEARRARRMDALMKMLDLWEKSNPGIGPVDGVEYQKTMRAEW